METARIGVVGLLVWAACSSSDGAAVRERPTTAPSPSPVTIVVDDARVSVALPVDRERASLHSLLKGPFADRARWQELHATSKDRRELGVRKPADTYREHTFYLFRHKSGKVALGLYRDLERVPEPLRVRFKDPVLELVDVETIHIKTVLEAPTTPPPEATVELYVPGKKPITLERQALHELEKQEKSRRAGWNIKQVAGLVLPERQIDHLVLHSTDGRTLTVDKELLASARIKMNQKGIWKFKPPVLPNGDEPEGFSPLAKIEVVPKKRKN